LAASFTTCAAPVAGAVVPPAAEEEVGTAVEVADVEVDEAPPYGLDDAVELLPLEELPQPAASRPVASSVAAVALRMPRDLLIANLLHRMV
jgi:hypothetical protein